MTDLISVVNANSRKIFSKFSGLRWFFHFEGLYKGEGSLQANKTNKKHQNLNLLFIHEMFLVYKLETFKNCKEANHFIILTIATIYIFLSYSIFD